MEEQLEFYLNLGKALYKFYDGDVLTYDEVSLIASSSNDDKIMALDFYASKRLAMRADRSLDNFARNSNALKLVNFTSRNR